MKARGFASELAGRFDSSVQDSDCTGPAGRGAFDLNGKARNREAGRRQQLQIVQLLDMAIADMAAGLVTFPDQARIPCLGVFSCREYKRRIPAPAVDACQ